MEQGFAVIFLHRKDSLRPFEHAIQSIRFAECSLKEAQQLLTESFEQFQKCREALLLVEYFSVADYLCLLSEISKLLAPLGNRVLLFLAAAVSDFYLDDTFISEHKIGSSQSGLSIQLSPVPKFIKLLKDELTPEACIVSFKLETEESKVLQKAEEALARYGHDLVVANVLATRKEKLWIVHRGGKVNLITKEANDSIERKLVQSLVQIIPNK